MRAIRPANPPEERKRHPTAASMACVFGLTVCVYLLSFSGVPISDDEQLYASGARNLAVIGSLSAEQLYGNPRLMGDYHGVEPAFPAIASLWYRLFSHSAFGHLQSLYLLPILFTGAAAALIVLLASQSGLSSTAGIVAGLMFGLATIAWPYAKTLFRETQIVLLLLAAWALFLFLMLNRHPVWMTVLGGMLIILLLAILALTKVTMGITGVLLLATVPFLPHRAGTSRALLRNLTLGCFLVILAMLIFSASSRATDQDIFYRFTAAFLQDAWIRLKLMPHSHLAEALLAPLVSPWKGLLFYSPVCLLGIVSFFKYHRRRPELFVLPFGILLTLSLTQAFAYDEEWWTPPWASRFLLPAVPLLIVASFPVLEEITRRTRLGLWLGGLGALGVVIQLPAVLFNSAEFTASLQSENPISFPADFIWNLSRLPMITQWQAGTVGPPDLLLWRTAAASPGLALVIIIGGLGLIVAFALKLSRRPTKPTGAGAIGQLSPILLLAFVPALAVLVLRIANLDPAYHSPELASMCAFMRDHIRKGEALVVQPYPGPVWQYLMNNECGQGRWYSQPYEPAIAANPAAGQVSEDLVTARLLASPGYWWIRQSWNGSALPDTTGLGGAHSRLVEEHYFHDPLDISIGFYSFQQ